MGTYYVFFPCLLWVVIGVIGVIGTQAGARARMCARACARGRVRAQGPITPITPITWPVVAWFAWQIM
jgi:hypothetical protein